MKFSLKSEALSCLLGHFSRLGYDTESAGIGIAHIGPGAFHRVFVKEIERLMSGGGSGRVQRRMTRSKKIVLLLKGGSAREDH